VPSESSTESENRRVTRFDARGRPTDDPAEAVGGEVAEIGPHGHPVRRTRFFLTRAELPWLPVGEAAFLLWVLAALVLVWASIGVFVRFA
jgi:hypothetical protein